MKNRKRFITHINNLSCRFNLQEENIICYCKNNNVSDQMTKRLINEFNKCNKDKGDQ